MTGTFLRAMNFLSALVLTAAIWTVLGFAIYLLVQLALR